MVIPSFTEDMVAFLLIVYSARFRGLGRTYGGPSLLDRILQDATLYFLAIFTSQLLVVLFELFAPVSGRSADMCSSAHNGPYPEADPTSSRKVRPYPRYFDGGFDRVLCFLYAAGQRCESRALCGFRPMVDATLG